LDIKYDHGLKSACPQFLDMVFYMLARSEDGVILDEGSEMMRRIRREIDRFSSREMTQNYFETWLPDLFKEAEIVHTNHVIFKSSRKKESILDLIRTDIQ
jgi:hypothetical protein